MEFLKISDYIKVVVIYLIFMIGATQLSDNFTEFIISLLIISLSAVLILFIKNEIYRSRFKRQARIEQFIEDEKEKIKSSNDEQ